MNLLAVGVGTVAALVASSTYYSVLAFTPAEGGTERPPAWKVLVELLRSGVVTVAFALALGELGITGVGGVLLFALVVWLAFPVAILSGSIIWENVPFRTAALHAGDWLMKSVLLALIVGLWR